MTAQHSASQHYAFIVYISLSYSYSTRKETGRRAGMLATLLTGLISVLHAVTPGVTLRLDGCPDKAIQDVQGFIVTTGGIMSSLGSTRAQAAGWI